MKHETSQVPERIKQISLRDTDPNRINVKEYYKFIEETLISAIESCNYNIPNSNEIRRSLTSAIEKHKIKLSPEEIQTVQEMISVELRRIFKNDTYLAKDIIEVKDKILEFLTEGKQPIDLYREQTSEDTGVCLTAIETGEFEQIPEETDLFQVLVNSIQAITDRLRNNRIEEIRSDYKTFKDIGLELGKIISAKAQDTNVISDEEIDRFLLNGTKLKAIFERNQLPNQEEMDFITDTIRDFISIIDEPKLFDQKTQDHIEEMINAFYTILNTKVETPIEELKEIIFNKAWEFNIEVDEDEILDLILQGYNANQIQNQLHQQSLH